MLDRESHNTGNVWTHHFPRHHLLAACGISLALTFLLAALPDSVVAYRAQELEPIPAIEPLPSSAAELEVSSAGIDPGVNETAVESTDPWIRLTVRKGDTFSSLLQKSGLDLDEIHAITASSKDAKKLASLNPGDELEILVKDGKAQELNLRKNELETVSVTHDGNKYESKKVVATPEIRLAYASGTIDSSLFLAGQKAGLNDRMTLKLADIFAYDIDFLQDIQKGDSFSLLYEELYLDGKPIGKGDIVSAEFVNQGKTYRAVQYKNKQGVTSYYSPDGTITRKQFLRTPVDFAKVTSYFNLNRRHPILHKIRAHKGIDYGAPTGTPVRAAGDGTVVFAGVRNGFGNVVMIQHGGAYTTLYGHLSRINVKNGARVSQGQLIGAVGQTGLATGPHLHYEFHVNGVAVNPLAHMNIAMAEPLSKSEKADFERNAQSLFVQMKDFASASSQPASRQLALGNNDPQRDPQVR